MFNSGQQPRPSARNTLYLDIPGLSSSLKVRFPECRLPVCGKCKKNYKTRDMCRTQGEHTALPWSTVYICCTLDPSCTDSNGKLKQGQYSARNIDWMPYCYKDDVDAETLICAACKTKNYTRKQCRVKSKHRYLPWSTVYVVLSCEGGDERAGPFLDDQKDADDSKETAGKRRAFAGEVGNNKRKKRAVGTDEPRSHDDSDTESEADSEVNKSESAKEKEIEDSDDLSSVDKSRTFLIEVDEKKCVVKWLDMDKSKAMPMQYYSSIPNQQTSVSPFQGQASALINSYGSRAQGRFPIFPLENIHSNGQFYPSLENQAARSFMPSLQLPAQYAHWQAGPNSAAMTHPATSAQFVDAGAADYPPSWYQKHIETQALHGQPSTRNWNAYQGQRFQVGQMMQTNMVPIQQGRASIAARQQYADFDQQADQYNVYEQNYMFVPTGRQDGL